MPVYVKRVDYQSERDVRDLTQMFREYAKVEESDREELDQIGSHLAKIPQAFSVLAYDGPDRNRVLGLINCFEGFSTFQLRPLVNVHDVIVTSEARGRGVASEMLDEVARIARDRNCCRLTLEVYASNTSARRAYEKHGFTRDPSHPDVDVFFLRKDLA